MSPRRTRSLPIHFPARGVAVRGSQRNAVPVDPRIQSTLETIRVEYGAPLTVSRMAARAGLSRSRFEHLFRRQTGRTFRATLHEVRVAKAAILLADSSCRVKEIADKCGYSSSQSLDRAFRKRFGKPPSAYRRSIYGYQIAHPDTTLKLTA
jgi:AraC family transcriptional regulator of arabinose operon